MKKNEVRLRSTLKECDRHLKRAKYALNQIALLLPLEAQKIPKLTEDEIAYIDQMIYRYIKLQDAMGRKLLRAILLYLDEDVENKAAIDMFNRSEQLGIIQNYDSWKEMRELRNELTHEYEEEDNDTAEKLNLLIDKLSEAEKYLNDIRTFLKNRKFIF